MFIFLIAPCSQTPGLDSNKGCARKSVLGQVQSELLGRLHHLTWIMRWLKSAWPACGWCRGQQMITKCWVSLRETLKKHWNYLPCDLLMKWKLFKYGHGISPTVFLLFPLFHLLSRKWFTDCNLSLLYISYVLPTELCNTFPAVLSYTYTPSFCNDL